MELIELIEPKVVVLHHDSLRVIICCLAGTATHKLYDMLGLTQHTDFEDNNNRIDEQEEELSEGATTDPADPDMASLPDSRSKEFTELQQPIEDSIQTAADGGEDITAAKPAKPTGQPHAHSSDQLPKGTKWKAAPVKFAAKRKAASQTIHSMM